MSTPSTGSPSELLPLAWCVELAPLSGAVDVGESPVAVPWLFIVALVDVPAPDDASGLADATFDDVPPSLPHDTLLSDSMTSAR